LLEYPEVRRRPFLLALERTLRGAAERDEIVGLLLIDITNLRRINTLHGHHAGDVALAYAQERMRSISTEADNVFRIGSHLFAFILPSLGNPALIGLAANRLREAATAPVEVGNRQFWPELRMGSASARATECDALELLARAEGALQHADHDLSTEFTDSAEEALLLAQDRARLEEEFKATLNANGFELFYQPKIDLRTGAVSACEALLRWPIPGGGYRSPQFAIELAESLNLGYALSKWVMGEALRQVRQWQERFELQVAINVEASLISNPDLYNLVSDTLAIWGARASLVTLEITESAVIEDKASGFDSLRRLAQLGVGLSIDDFGTGYSSLSYFKLIPAQELKIDQYFIKRMATDPQDQALVATIVDIAHVFGMQVVGEGVQEKTTLDALMRAGADLAQGFLLSPPLSAPEFEHWLDQWEKQPWPQLAV
jgi:diguanylate cyclase (GGDEF)-like protein